MAIQNEKVVILFHHLLVPLRRPCANSCILSSHDMLAYVDFRSRHGLITESF